MEKQLKPYREVREQMRPGDIIAFGGRSRFSELIKFSTRSNVSHVAMVFQSKMLNDNKDRYFNQVMEATTYQQFSGVMVNRLSERIANYNGEVWWLPLGESARQQFNDEQEACFEFAMSQERKPYDMPQALRSAIDIDKDWGIFDLLSRNNEDFTSFFCSELSSAMLEAAKVLPTINASEITPIDLCRFDIFAERYVQLKGEPKPIRGYNSICPTWWQDSVT
ncbi:MAG: hypothetical protein ACFHVJ_10135 [Aestuariibacter sp.]